MSIYDQVQQDRAEPQGVSRGGYVAESFKSGTRMLVSSAMTAAVYSTLVFAVTGAAPALPLLAVPIAAKAVGAVLNNWLNPFPAHNVIQDSRSMMGVGFVQRQVGWLYNVARNNIIPFGLFLAGMATLDANEMMPEGLKPSFETLENLGRGAAKYLGLSAIGTIATSFINNRLGIADGRAMA